uniref:F-box associated domain-containing protein n=1 Tax=Oryza punctata TaxID=4537 RepID=A0A0E0LI79_ORYPU
MRMYHAKVKSYAFGKISSTGVYKALGIIRFYHRQLCEVITVDDNNQRHVEENAFVPMRCVVIDWVVYFMMDFYPTYFEIGVLPVEPGSIASFNLETEKWMTALTRNLTCGGCLVTVHNIPPIRMDLWFLTDSETGIWVKKFSLPSQFIMLTVHPFLVLDGGRVYIRNVNKEFTSEDPRTGARAIVKPIEFMESSLLIRSGQLVRY